MNEFKLIVAGSRTFGDYGLMKSMVREFMTALASIKGERKTTIISGGAKGADALGEIMAKQYGLKVMVVKANWERDGRGAGYARNERMAEIGNACIIFCMDGSRGSTHMRDWAVKMGIPTAFVEINGEEVKMTISNLLERQGVSAYTDEEIQHAHPFNLARFS